MSPSTLQPVHDDGMQSHFMDERIPTEARDSNGIEPFETTVDGPGPVDGGGDTSSARHNRCGWFSFQGHRESRGINIAGIARGAISMSNVYFANVLIHFACKQGGGFEIEGKEYCTNYGVTVYGMKPAALVSNIAIIASVLAALLMPIFGAIIDYTPHRRMVGVWTAVCLAVISAIQIGTVEETWFFMAILQAVIFMIFQVQVMTLYAYFPEVNSDVGPKKMNEFTSTWSMLQFFSQAIFNICIIAVSFTLKLNVVRTSMLSQAGTAVFCGVFLFWAWRLIPNRPRRHKLPKGQSLMFAGFSQNLKTYKTIWKNYKKGLRWFLIATVFGEAAASAVSSTAVIFLNGNLGLTPIQIGLFFEVSLVTVIIGTKIGALVTKYTNPNTSLKLSELGLCLSIVIGVHLVQDAKVQSRVYIWGAVIGIFLGWFYPAGNLMFSQCIPRGQEAELAGFFVYCSQILGWFPPLIFTIMVQNSVNMKWALTCVASVLLVSIFFLCLCGSWPEILEEAKTTNVQIIPDDDSGDINCDDGDTNSVVNIASGDKKNDAGDKSDNGI